jgi:hypothetical protein
LREINKKIQNIFKNCGMFPQKIVVEGRKKEEEEKKKTGRENRHT